jgi:hypothetical protein
VNWGIGPSYYTEFIAQRILKVLPDKYRAGIVESVQRRAARPGLDSWQGQERFPSIPQRPDWVWGPLSLPSNPCRNYFLSINRPELETDHVPSSSAEVSNGGAIIPLPLFLHFMVLNYLSTRETIPLPSPDIFFISHSSYVLFHFHFSFRLLCGLSMMLIHF